MCIRPMWMHIKFIRPRTARGGGEGEYYPYGIFTIVPKRFSIST